VVLAADRRGDGVDAIRFARNADHTFVILRALTSRSSSRHQGSSRADRDLLLHGRTPGPFIDKLPLMIHGFAESSRTSCSACVVVITWVLVERSASADAPRNRVTAAGAGTYMRP